VTGSILRRIAEGDKAAVQECIDCYGGLVWSLARRLSPTRADAEDAVQEIFIDLWKSAARFDPAQSSETSFVAMIARRRLIDRLRRFERAPVTEELSAEMLDGRRQDKQIELNSEAALAAQALSQLRPEQQQVLQLAIYQGLSHQEIASATGMPLGTVKTHARRGLLHIREALGIRSLSVEKEAR
jgi:RNA polymerase sigma-70 factor, ECF subfamily